MSALQELLIADAKARAIKRPGTWFTCDVPVMSLDLRTLRIERLPVSGIRRSVRWDRESKRYDEEVIRTARRRARGILACIWSLIPRIVIEWVDN